MVVRIPIVAIPKVTFAFARSWNERSRHGAIHCQEGIKDWRRQPRQLGTYHIPSQQVSFNKQAFNIKSVSVNGVLLLATPRQNTPVSPAFDS